MTRLTAGTGFDVAPAWSPDGKQIAFISGEDFASGSLRLIQAEEGSAVRLSRPILARDKLEFDPSGKRLLGKFREPGKDYTLAWLTLEDGRLDPVATGLPGFRNFALSHDGKTIALYSSLDVPGQQSGNDGPENDVWTLPAEGGTPRKVVRFPARIHSLCWSAGDRSLVVSTELGGAHDDLWEFPLATLLAGARRLTFTAGDEGQPSVSRDGRWLVHTDNREGPTAVAVRDRTDNSEQVVKVPAT